jgi:hypothetical protein
MEYIIVTFIYRYLLHVIVIVVTGEYHDTCQIMRVMMAALFRSALRLQILLCGKRDQI